MTHAPRRRPDRPRPVSLIRNHASAILFTLVTLVIAAAPAYATDLTEDLQAILRDRLLDKASAGLQIVRLGADPAQDQLLFNHRAEVPLIPASNLKLVTTSAALDRFGPDFRFQTLLVQRGEDLVLVGDGDPTFGDAELLRKVGWDTTTVFQNWAQQLRKAELVAFRNVLVDDSVFDETFLHPNWPPDQEQARYVAQVAGMSLNLNCLDFYIRGAGAGNIARFRLNPPTRYADVANACISGGDSVAILTRQRGTNNITLRGACPAAGESILSVTIHDPALYAATVLAETLQSGGVHVEGKVMRDRTVRPLLQSQAANQKSQMSGRILAVHETPLPQVLARANKDSVNLYAESLCKRLGAAATNQSGSWQNGTAALAAHLHRIGIDPGQYKLDDGSGLSRENTISADALSRVLRFNYHSPNRDQFMASLAVGGQDGTLDDRFRQPELRGRVFAKSGYISGVSALSGYVKARDGGWYTFCILMNNLARGTNPRAKALQDQVIKAIDAHSMGRR